MGIYSERHRRRLDTVTRQIIGVAAGTEDTGRG